jgi:carboxyl-terminal processing protease
MRALLVSPCLLFCPILLAAPVPVGSRTAAPSAKQEWIPEALNYAQSLLSVVNQVSASYVREVDQVDLLEAALTGLYQAARQPVPSNLRAELKRLDDAERVNFLIRARHHLGSCAMLQNHRDLLESCRTMLRTLDPHSGVITLEDRKNQPWGDQPVGIGLELADNFGAGPLRVSKVHPGGSAQRAGMLPGDVITEIEADPVEGKTSAQATSLIQKHARAGAYPGWNLDIPPPGMPEAAPRPVRVTFARPGQKLRQITLEFQTGRPESVLGVIRRQKNTWDYLLDRKHKVAYVRITSLNRGTADELIHVLAGVAEEARGLILDLRWCPGGFLDEALNVSGLFLDEDRLITEIRGRKDTRKEYRNPQTRHYLSLPLVVLVNGETSGGAELVAAALQDHQRATIVGQRSRGKASVQTALYISLPGSGIKLTSGEFIRPSRKNLHRRSDSRRSDDWGVRPSPGLEFRISPDLNRHLHDAYDRLALRPGTSIKRLSLDDPTEDPQRQAALAAVLDRMRAARP